MIKILFLIPTLGHGGAERVLLNLANNMDHSRFDVSIQTLFDTGIYQSQISREVKYIPGLKTYFRGNTKIMKLFSPRTLYRFFVRDTYDLVISYLEGSSARIVSGCTDSNTKKISWIHIEQNTPQIAAESYRSVNELIACYDAFDQIVAVSDIVKNDFQSIVSTSTPTRTIYNVIESRKIICGAKETVTDIKFCRECINLCSVAKLMKTKGYDRLVSVSKRLKEDGFKFHIYIVGKGEEAENLKKMISEYGVEEYWTLLGFRENPYKYVAQCDLYICSSRREGFSTAVSEALIIGKPVVSTECSGARELLGECDEYGIVTENSEEGIYHGLRRILSDPKLLAYYTEQAKARGAFFNTETRIKETEDFFLEVIGK